MGFVLKNIATLGFVGYIPIAPGTLGSLVAFFVFISLKPSIFIHLIILLFIIPIGVISSHYAERVFNERDSRNIVIDEFCGYLVSVTLLPLTLFYTVSAFFLFRFFDILKPFPIRKIESIGGGKAIVADDLVAAMYTNLILQIWNFIDLVKYIR